MDKVIEETKCEFYDDYECNAYYDIYPEPEDCQRDLCRTHEDCYYRQLKRLQAENEKLDLEYHRLKGQFKIVEEALNDNIKKVVELKAENERLKKEVETWNYQADKRAELSNIWFNTAEKYKQTLQEIREYCEEQNLKVDYTACEIIDKIDSVIGAEE